MDKTRITRYWAVGIAALVIIAGYFGLEPNLDVLLPTVVALLAVMRGDQAVAQLNGKLDTQMENAVMRAEDQRDSDKEE